MCKTILFTHYNTDCIQNCISSPWMNKTLQHFFVFLFSQVWVFFFQFFPLLKTDAECFLLTVAFFNMLHSCWRQYCLNPSQYCYQNIKSYCQVSWYSNLLTRTRYKGVSLSHYFLINVILSGVRIYLGRQDLPGIILWWRLQHADVGIPLMSSSTCFFFKSTTSFIYSPAGTQLFQIHLSDTLVLSTIPKESPINWEARDSIA